MAANYVLSFLEGVLSFISPCILPLLPVYFFYLAGVSGEEAGTEEPGKGRLIINSLGFVIGFTVVFVVLGATATSLGHFLKDHIVFFRKLSGIIMIIFGLNFVGVFRLGFLNAEKRFSFDFKQLRFLSSIVFGIVFSFGWTPCVGAFLSSALLMAGNSATILQGITLLLVYSAGLGVPFILASLVFENIKGAFRQLQRYNRIINIVSGIVLLLAGILVYTDNLRYLGFYL